MNSRDRVKTHEYKVAAAKAALDKVFSDTAVVQSITRASLMQLRDEIDEMLDALRPAEEPDR